MIGKFIIGAYLGSSTVATAMVQQVLSSSFVMGLLFKPSFCISWSRIYSCLWERMVKKLFQMIMLWKSKEILKSKPNNLVTFSELYNTPLVLKQFFVKQW
jgi:hypothetical protein